MTNAMLNIFSSENKTMSPTELSSVLENSKNEVVLVDVRTPAEFAGGSITGAVNIPFDELEQHINMLTQYAKVYLFCHSGGRSKQACALLARNGIENTKELHGGIIAWMQAGFPTTR